MGEGLSGSPGLSVCLPAQLPQEVCLTSAVGKRATANCSRPATWICMVVSERWKMVSAYAGREPTSREPPPPRHLSALRTCLPQPSCQPLLWSHPRSWPCFAGSLPFCLRLLGSCSPLCYSKYGPWTCGIGLVVKPPPPYRSVLGWGPEGVRGWRALWAGSPGLGGHTCWKGLFPL